MNWRKFKFTDDSFVITKVTNTYKRTESNRSWKVNPETTETEMVTAEYYTNYITACPFFNNFGDGATCRAFCSYTQAGYLPVRVVTVSPYREKKIVTTFSFTERR